MISRLNAPFRKLVFSTDLINTPVTTQPGISVYIKPFLLATAITMLLSVAVCFLFITLTGSLSAADKAPDTLLNIHPSKDVPPMLQDSAACQKEQTRFINDAKTKYPEGFKATNASVTVQLSDRLLYRLHYTSTLARNNNPG